jgi:N-terminal domain of NWD NACHT-NTPase
MVSMPHLWRQRFPWSRNSSSNRQIKDPPNNASTSAATADVTIGSQDPRSSNRVVPVVHIVGHTSALPIESPLLPRNSLPQNSETEALLGDQVDLWDEAYKKLKKEQPKLFEYYKHCIVASGDESATPPPFNLDNLDSEQREQYLANQIEKRLQTIQEQEWSTAGDVYKKIVKTVLFAKDFVAQAVSHEPHAALAWAGVSMLLPVSGPE